MKTDFTLAQLADPDLAAVNTILRTCVHCGFCTATCPTYVLLGDELDSPRGRIYMLKNMFETGEPAPAKVVTHVDRCLSCLSCMTTCPASVNYMHLVDRGRAHIEATFTRPMAEQLLRKLLTFLLPYPGRFRLSLIGARLLRPLAPIMPGRLKSLFALVPSVAALASPVDRPQVFPAEGKRRKRVALMCGCAQQVLKPTVNEATVRLLTRLGCEIVVASGAGCCGALVHHMGRDAAARAAAKANITAWERAAAADGGLDAIISNASGCGVVVKDYGHMLRADPDWTKRGQWVSDICRDVSEVVEELGLPAPVLSQAPVVTYHGPCSMQHGLKLKATSPALLQAAGFEVRQPAEGHLCCGSAGIYNVMQPAIADQLLSRKLTNIRATHPEVVATGNIGCMVQLEGGMMGGAKGAAMVPVVHTVELLDWATGGPKPKAIR